MQANIDKAALDKLLENVHTLDEKIKDAVFDEITLTALEIESDAKNIITANKSVVTGRLRSSIKAIWDREKFAALVGTNVEYGPYVEFGTAKQNAKPFLYPAYFAGIGRLSRNLQNILKDVK